MILKSIALQEAMELSQQIPLPEDIIEQLDKLAEDIFSSEELVMAFIYEGALLALSEK